MLTTLTILTGAYSVANISRIMTNSKLVKNGKIITPNGLRYIKSVDITSDGIMYKIYAESSNRENCQYINCGYTFETRDAMRSYIEDSYFRAEEIKYFNTYEDYLIFCQKTNINPNRYRFSETMVKLCPITKSDEVWMLCDIDGSIKCEEMAKMSEREFKNLVKSKNRLPFGFSILFAFMTLFMITTTIYLDERKLY